MSSPAPFAPVGAIIERSLNIKHVYGEPVQRGDTTVIPIATVAYGFGAGGGAGYRRPEHAPDGGASEAEPVGQGAGGGGGLRMSPAGALEIGPGGTRFVPFQPVLPLAGVALVGLALGWLIGRRG